MSTRSIHGKTVRLVAPLNLLFRHAVVKATLSKLGSLLEAYAYDLAPIRERVTRATLLGQPITFTHEETAFLDRFFLVADRAVDEVEKSS